jgi:hypothetical protein
MYTSHTVAYHPVAKFGETIDQVIQSGQPLTSFQYVNTHGSEPNLIIDTSNPAPPISSWAHRAASSVQTSQQVAYEERYGSSPAGRFEGDSYSGNSICTTRKNEDINNKVGGEPTPLSSLANGDIADFFSSEVFQIVLHNPTTAHQFLKFCQGRGYGENMEFLQKVRQCFGDFST